MLQKTNGIVLRSVKYGETSLITTIFTQHYGVYAYMVQGVRSSKAKQHRAGLFQPGTILSLVVYHQPNKNLQRIREYQVAHIYSSVHEEVIKNSIVLFSVEVLLRLLPEGAAMPDLFSYTESYLKHLDILSITDVANFPLAFVAQCSHEFGFDLKGAYTAATPYLNLAEGGYSDHAPMAGSPANETDGQALTLLLKINSPGELHTIKMNADMRLRLLDWYVEYLQVHTQHMGNVRSLPILRSVLH